MNKISNSVTSGVGSAPQDITPRALTADMAPPEFTPLTPPGQRPIAMTSTASGPRNVPEHRQALFDRSLVRLQQKLADRRLAGLAENAGSHGTSLSAGELRDADAALQWISAHLSAAAER